jgi:hypothetical protein
MKRHSWCPFKIEQIVSTHSQATAYYLSRLFKKSLQLDHSHCTVANCVANNVDMANYTTKYATPGCTCAHIPFPDAEMRKTIADGGIPVVRVRHVAENGSPEIEVVKMTSTTRYIAFSHVWSDGMRNPSANTLLECQMRRLQRYVDDSKPPADSSFISIPTFNFESQNKRH